jgi:predicted nucleotidyltransferase
METQKDFKELLESFNAQGVEFVIVGAHALAFHGAPRYTGDIDLLVKPSTDNARRIMEGLMAFGFGDIGLEAADFETPGSVIQLGQPPVRVDIMTSIDGVSWDAVDSDKTPGQYADLDVFYIGREQFIANKKAIGRHKDLADIEMLKAND